MLVDANLLLYAVDSTSPWHDAARRWWEDALNGARRVGVPWVTLTAFVRISTHPRAWDRPLDPVAAVEIVGDWLAVETVWCPGPGPRHAGILLDLLAAHRITGNLVTDAQLVALALEHGLEVHSADSDFARFPEVTWVNPIARG